LLIIVKEATHSYNGEWKVRRKTPQLGKLIEDVKAQQEKDETKRQASDRYEQLLIKINCQRLFINNVPVPNRYMRK